MELLFSKGYGFELIDGDHFIYWGSILNRFNTVFSNLDQLMTVSVKGPQSSGKSTLMNLQYGTDFKSGSGKCTSGINGFIMNFEEDFEIFEQNILKRGKRKDTDKVDKEFSMEDKKDSFSNDELKRFDSISIVDRLSFKNEVRDDEEGKKYILFLDSQGMLSVEQRNMDFDRKIGTFLLAVSQMLLVNFEGELDLNFKNLLEITNYTYMSLNLDKKSLFCKNEGTDEVEKGNLFLINCINF